MSGRESHRDLWRSSPDDLSPDLLSQLLHELDEIDEGDGLEQALVRSPRHVALDQNDALDGEARRDRDALDQRLLRHISLVHLDPAATVQEDLRFRRELLVAGGLGHPGVPAVYGLFRDAAGQPFYTTAKLCGRPLSEVLELACSGHQGWTRIRLLQVILRVAETLDYAHRRGVVHRDVRPSKVRVGEFGEAWLIGWNRSCIGTPVDPADDLAAVGQLVQSLLDRAWQPAELVAIAAMAQATRGPDGPQCYTGMAELAGDLQAFLDQRVVRAYRTGVWAELRCWVRRHRRTCTALLALLLTVLVATVALYSVQVAGRDRVETEERRATAALADLRRLGDTQRVAELLAEEPHLWPAVPARVGAMQQWIERAEQLLGRKLAHQTRLTEFAPLGEITSGAGALSPEREWEHAVRLELCTRLERLAVLLPKLRQRHELAQTLRERTVTGSPAAALWHRVRTEIRRLPVYAGLDLPPQLGLLPLWRDQASGLWQFLHLASGVAPERNAESGQPIMHPRTGIVLVLLPGGTARLGSRPVSEQFPAGSEHADRDHGELEGPVHEVSLRPFFLSRYELSQAQWERLGLHHDSYQSSPCRPVERVDYLRAIEFCRRSALLLPTEAQWEYSCRAGTTTVYWSGDAAESLADHGNVASRELRIAFDNSVPAESWADGYVHTAPVGSYRPNGFGLFDMHGNVREWCRDWRDDYSFPTAGGDGLRGTRSAPFSARIVRGGSWLYPARRARSAAREAGEEDHLDSETGLRPARAIER